MNIKYPVYPSMLYDYRLFADRILKNIPIKNIKIVTPFIAIFSIGALIANSVRGNAFARKKIEYLYFTLNYSLLKDLITLAKKVTVTILTLFITKNLLPFFPLFFKTEKTSFYTIFIISVIFKIFHQWHTQNQNFKILPNNLIKITDFTAVVLKTIEVNFPTIDSLVIEINPLSKIIIDHQCRLFFSKLENLVKIKLQIKFFNLAPTPIDWDTQIGNLFDLFSKIKNLSIEREQGIDDFLSLDALKRMTSLTSLEILTLDHFSVEWVNELSAALPIKSLTLVACNISSISQLKKLSSLNKLSLKRCQNIDCDDDFSNLSQFKNLQEIELDRCERLSIDCLQSINKNQNLEKYKIYFTGFSLEYDRQQYRTHQSKKISSHSQHSI